jgi:uncharacterized membrane protein
MPPKTLPTSSTPRPVTSSSVDAKVAPATLDRIYSVECDGGNLEGGLAALLAGPRRGRPRDRVVDATFALALTLLVTAVDVDHPRIAFSGLGALNDAVGQQFVAFAIAFAVIANYWLQHHRLIASFAAIDYTGIVVNLFLIAAIVLLPFSTQAVGDPGVEHLPLPTVIMAVNVVAASLLYTLVYVVAVRRNLLTTVPSRAEVSHFVVNALAAAVVFAASVPVAYLISPTAARSMEEGSVDELLDVTVERPALE